MLSKEVLAKNVSTKDRPLAIDPASWSKHDTGLAGGSIVEPTLLAAVQTAAASPRTGQWMTQSDSESHGPFAPAQIPERLPFPPAGTLSAQWRLRCQIRDRVDNLVAEKPISRLVDEVNLQLSQYRRKFSDISDVAIQCSEPIDDLILLLGLLKASSILEQEPSASAHNAIYLDDMPVIGPPSPSPHCFGSRCSQPSRPASPRHLRR